MNEKECEITSLNFVWKILICFIIGMFLSILLYENIVLKNNEGLGYVYFGIPFWILMLAFAFFYKMRYSESGIDYIIGIIREDGSVLGYIRSRPWDSEWNYTIDEILFFAVLLNKLTPFSAISNNLVLKNFSGACRMIYKYQVMLTERDKKLLRKYGKIDKYESKKLRNSKAAKLWDSVPED